MDLKQIHRVYFLGIGGIGMSALARWFNAQGCVVSGYDKTPTPLTSKLIEEGIHVHFEDNSEAILTDAELVVYTPAIPATHSEFIILQNSDIPMLKRSQVLGEISKQYKTIAIAGTHGKTTVTSMVAHILKENKVQLSAFIGGIANNFNSNLVLSESTDVVVVEADEFDRSFLTLHPDIAIVTSMDADHLDIYGAESDLKESFFLFTEQIRKHGTLIQSASLDRNPKYKYHFTQYSSTMDCSYQIQNLYYSNGWMEFDIKTESELHSNFRMAMPGRHNAENALAASIACHTYGLSFEEIKNALATYKGVKRRFDIRVHTDDKVYIDDYAHHPKELESTILATKEMFPDKKICGIFQPHLFTRTRDFADDFAKSLALLDELGLMEIYPARELPIEGVTSQFLLNKVDLQEKTLLQREEVENFALHSDADVILTLGAGDIDRHITTIENLLSQL